MKSLRWVWVAGGLLWGPGLFAQDTFAVEASSGPRLSTAALQCDVMEFSAQENTVRAEGNALLTSSGTRLEADEIFMDLNNRSVQARGRVLLEEGGMSVLAEDIALGGPSSTGTLTNVYLQEGPWRVWARRVQRLNTDVYRLEQAAFTSCELDPPHYHFRAHRAKYVSKKSLSVTGARFAAESTSVLFVPYYRKSFKDNPWTLTVDPGNSARNGVFAKTVFTYPLSETVRARLLWDYFQKTGNGLGAEFSYFQPTVRGSLSGYTIQDRLDDSQRWNLRFGHWQQVAPRWSVQSNVAFQSDETVNNIFVRDDFQRVRRLGESNVALTYGGPLLTHRLFVEHDRSYDDIENRFVTQKSVLPQWSFQTSPLKLGRTHLYLDLSGNMRNEYLRPSVSPPAPNPLWSGQDHYRQFAEGTSTLRWRLPLTQNITIEPSAGVREQWQSHRSTGTELDPRDLTQGRGVTGFNWRHRLSRALDYELTHRTTVRWTPNTFRRDHAASDRGVEQNNVSFFGSYYPSTAFWARATTAYDLRDAPGLGFRSPRQRLSPPALEINAVPRPWARLFFREVVQVYPTRKPQSTVANLRLGRDDQRYFTTGMSYNVGFGGQLDLSQGAAFSLTPGWWLSGDVHYTVRGNGGTTYNSVQFKEKNLVVRRDLHCWVLRVTYRERPGVYEAFVRLDLKTNWDSPARRALADEIQFYPARDTRGDQ